CQTSFSLLSRLLFSGFSMSAILRGNLMIIVSSCCIGIAHR
ncbi:MAG: hypothetical protein, partial [Olavius algarvensis spirochete endosymbiont]